MLGTRKYSGKMVFEHKKELLELNVSLFVEALSGKCLVRNHCFMVRLRSGKEKTSYCDLRYYNILSHHTKGSEKEFTPIINSYLLTNSGTKKLGTPHNRDTNI